MIRSWFRRLTSFGSKVVWLLTFSGGLAVLLVAIGIVVFAYFDLRREVVSGIESKSRLIAMNSGAPLVFDDPVSGQEALDSLYASPHVAAATVFTLRGERFARFEREVDAAPPLPLAAELGLSRSGEWLVWTRRVEDSGRLLGFVQLVFDLDRLHGRIASMLAVVVAIAIGAMLLIHIVARGMSGLLVRPVAELAGTARAISQTRNFDLRAAAGSSDEIGQLTDAFNAMLDELQKQHADLQAARRDAERASRSKDEFLATLSHELRTPMTPILGWSQILLRSEHDPARVRQGAEIIERNARIQTRIIDDLLDMSRIIAGKMVLRVEEVDLAQVARSALATVQAAAEARGVALEVDLDAGVPRVRGDPNRLQQVLWNLLSNAIKFTPRGGRVEVRLAELEDCVRLMVRDDGLGMSPQLLPHVFERFRQADSSTTRVQGGLGLGLAIVRQLVEQHGGTVEAASAGLGEGSTFFVDLPLPRERNSPDDPVEVGPSPGEIAAQSPLAHDTGERHPLAGQRVLLVDDEADARHLMALVLGEAGATVRTAGSAGTALEMLRRAPADVLVSDIGMPDMDGYELIRILRQRSEREGGATAAIALTAFAREEDRQRALDAGFQLHVGKPVDPEDLIAAVASLAVRSRVAADLRGS